MADSLDFWMITSCKVVDLVVQLYYFLSSYCNVGMYNLLQPRYKVRKDLQFHGKSGPKLFMSVARRSKNSDVTGAC
jgi:hypothetical protein